MTINRDSLVLFVFSIGPQVLKMINSLPWLRHSLPEHLDNIRHIRAIAENTGIDLAEIAWENPMALIWHQIITICERQQLLSSLVENILVLKLETEKITKLKEEISFQKKVDQVVSSLPIDYRKMGLIDTINCGRQVESGDFWKLDQISLGTSPLLTGIVLGPDQQNPLSLAERLSLEFFNEFDAEDEPVFYFRDGSGQRMRPLKIATGSEVDLHNIIDQYLESMDDGHELTHFRALAHLVEVDLEISEKIIYEVFDIIYQKLETFHQEKKITSLLLIVYSFTLDKNVDRLNQHLKAKSGEYNQVKYYRINAGVKVQEIANWFNANASSPIENIQKYLDPFIEAWLDVETRTAFKEKQVLPVRLTEQIQNQIFQSVMHEKLAP